MKEKMCFYCQQLGYIIANCLKNIIKITSVMEIAGIAINNSKILGKD